MTNPWSCPLVLGLSHSLSILVVLIGDLDDDYITKMEDVLEIYERPYDPQQPVVCLDEKPTASLPL